MSGNLKKLWGSEVSKIVKQLGPTNPEDPSNKLSKILNMGSISPRKHDMEIIVNMLEKTGPGKS